MNCSTAEEILVALFNDTTHSLTLPNKRKDGRSEGNKNRYIRRAEGKIINCRYHLNRGEILGTGRCRYCLNRDLLYRYGITLEKYEELLKNQDSECAICKKRVVKLDIDHCHRTKKLRGLLCNPCNRALGLFKENVENLKNALIYLKQNEVK